jgi:hypothetical protein
MRCREFVAVASIVLFACCPFATGARACVATYNQTNSFCDGCKYQASILVSRNETCERYNAQPALGHAAIIVEFIDGRIAERAKHGVAGANGNVVAYKPDKDYVGSDEFVKEVVFRQNGKLGRYQVRYFVTVK